MSSYFGIQADDWHAVKGEIRDVLAARARVRGMIPYSELVSKLTTVHLEPDSFALAALLGEVSTEEDAAGRGMLSVIVVHKHGDMQPGSGFFKLASQLGRDTTDIIRCWVDELHAVHHYWSTKHQTAGPATRRD